MDGKISEPSVMIQTMTQESNTTIYITYIQCTAISRLVSHHTTV